METLIERYIYDVIRRLPEKEREEVRRELRSNIYDMLPDNADDAETRAVLYQLGAPASLAEKYRQKPRYLISPAIYDDYERLLKWILPLLGIGVFIIGIIVGAVEAINDGIIDAPHFFSHIISKGSSMGVYAALQGLVWTTLGYAIAERVGAFKEDNKKQEWTLEDLPDPMPNNKSRIPLSDSLTDLVLSVGFCIAVIFVCSGVLPLAFMIKEGNTDITNIFSSDFLAACIPAFSVIAFLSVCECVVKIKERRWTLSACVAVITSNLLSMGIMVYLLNRTDLFSTEFITFLQSKEWGSFDLLRFAGKGGINPVIILISVIIIVSTLAVCGSAVYKTLRYKK